MIYTQHKDVQAFLTVARQALERDECGNGLMLGVSLRLAGPPPGKEEPAYLATVTAPEGLAAAALMTPPYKLQLYLAEGEDSAGLEVLVDGLARNGWPVTALLAREDVAETFALLWAKRKNVRWRKGTRQRLHQLRTVNHPPYPPGELTLAEEEDLDLARQWAREFHEACFHDENSARNVKGAEEKVATRTLYFWAVDGTPRSMAARTRPTPHGESVSFVYTPREHRNRGYASAVVARLSQTILDGGKEFCTLFTDLSNPTSNHIYQVIGYVPVADMVDIHFESSDPE